MPLIKKKNRASNSSRIATDIDFERDGKQVGYLRLPHSVHRSAYGHLAMPIAVIKKSRISSRRC
ncbi:MAG: hypothetical protein HYR63_03000 [Proteobacteria bacterium]|nr:hypothetical protein [Pseudomonadota bacterium]